MAKRKRNLLDPTLVGSQSSICILDSDRRIRFVTPGFEQVTGWTSEQLEGLVCLPAPADPANAIDLLTSAMAPNLDVLQGTAYQGRSLLPTANGRSIEVELNFVPLNNADQEVARILLTLQPLTATPNSTPLAQRLHAEITALRLQFRQRFSGKSFVGSSPAIVRARQQAELLSQGNANYHVVGPSGSGRQHFARLVHATSGQQETSFVRLSCRLLAAETLLTTLRQLRQLDADGPTAKHQKMGALLLHEVEQCPREVQQWLLENYSSEAATIRLVASSAIPLETLVSDGWMLAAFAELFSCVEVSLPPLHQRDQDVLLLAQSFLESSQRQEKTSAEAMAEAFRSELQFYRWPGNVRELRQVIEAACQNSFGNMLTTEDLPFHFQAGLQAQAMPAPDEQDVHSLEDMLKQFEIDVLQSTLQKFSGNKAEAARRLGMTRPRFYRRLRSLGLDSTDDED